MYRSAPLPPITQELVTGQPLGFPAMRIEQTQQMLHGADTRTPSQVIVRRGRDTVHKGDVIHVTTEPRHVHVFDSESGERLSA